MFKKYLDKKLVRYILVGGISYAIELAILFFLLQTLGLHRTLATGMSFWFSILTSFFLQKVLVFADKDKDFKKLSRQGSLFFSLVMFNYIFTLLMVSAIDDKYIFYSRTLALAIVTIWNFFIYKRLVFGGKV
jgi:putative flippase GtrA